MKRTHVCTGARVHTVRIAGVQVKLTVSLALLAVPINTVFGVWFAILLVRSEFKGKTLVMSMLDLPFSISPVVTGEQHSHTVVEPQLRGSSDTSL